MLELSYNDPPTNLDEFWKIIDEQVQFIENDYDELHLETAAEAKKRKKTQVPREYDSSTFWYRKSDNRSIVEFYFDDLKTNFPKLRELTRKRQLSPEFSYWLARIAFAHGFLMNSAFVLQNDLIHETAGAVENEVEKKWIALAIIEMKRRGLVRKVAEEHIEKLLRKFRVSPSTEKQQAGLHEIANKVLDKHGYLKSTYKNQKFYGRLMKEAVKYKVEVPDFPKGFFAT